jgi:hypothetical protein
MWKLLKFSWEVMTSGRCTPAAVKAMPKAEPQKIVDKMLAAILSTLREIERPGLDEVDKDKET